MAKSSLNSYDILGEQFANYANSSRTVSVKTKRTIMNTGYANSSRTLFEQLFANRISETQTPELTGSLTILRIGEGNAPPTGLINRIEQAPPHGATVRILGQAPRAE